ncbi:MAG: hypothetical protein QM796_16435 [Chthoniobacteraceae bacterium]
MKSTPGRLVEAQRMPLTAAPAEKPEITQAPDGSVRAAIDESPLYLTFHP